MMPYAKLIKSECTCFDIYMKFIFIVHVLFEQKIDLNNKNNMSLR